MSPATVCPPGLSLCSFSRSIDTSEAKKVPGFVCFLTEEDIPHSNVTGLCNDETVFAKDKVYLEIYIVRNNWNKRHIFNLCSWLQIPNHAYIVAIMKLVSI